MAVLEDIAQLVINDGRFGTAGDGVTVDTSAIGKTQNVVLIFIDGPIDPDLQDGPFGLVFQAVVRDPSYSAGLSRASDLLKLLTLRQQTVGTHYILECYPRHHPIPVGRQESGIYSFLINFDAVWRRV